MINEESLPILKHRDTKMTNEEWLPILKHMVSNLENGRNIRAGLQKRTHCAWDEWSDVRHPDSMEFNDKFEYRIKPATITVNGREIDAPLKVAPKYGSNYFTPVLDTPDMCWTIEWYAGLYDMYRLEHGLCFDTREKAIAFTKAVLGIE